MGDLAGFQNLTGVSHNLTYFTLQQTLAGVGNQAAGVNDCLAGGDFIFRGFLGVLVHILFPGLVDNDRGIEKQTLASAGESVSPG